MKFATYNEHGHVYGAQTGSPSVAEAFTLTGKTYVEVEDSVDISSIYVDLETDPPTVAARSEVTISASTTAIEADGVDECSITGLPTSSLICISLYGTEQIVSVDEDPWVFTTSTPGEYIIELIGPHKSNELLIVAREATLEVDNILYKIDKMAEDVRRDLEFGNFKFAVLPGQTAVREVKYQESLTVLRKIESLVAGGDTFEEAAASAVALYSSAEMPMLHAEVGAKNRDDVVMETIVDVATNVVAARNSYNIAMSAIENVRIMSKQAVRAATTYSAAMHILDTIEWPS